MSSLNPPPLSGNSMLDRWMSWLWEYIRQITGLPVQTGNSGKVLTTNGVTASWVTPQESQQSSKSIPVFFNDDCCDGDGMIIPQPPSQQSSPSGVPAWIAAFSARHG